MYTRAYGSLAFRSHKVDTSSSDNNSGPNKEAMQAKEMLKGVSGLPYEA